MRTIILALGFMLMFEGIMPLVMPDRWQKSMREISQLPESTVRAVACAVVIAGLAIVWGVEEFF